MCFLRGALVGVVLLLDAALVDLFKCSYIRLVSGTGKSLLLRAIIAALRKKHAGKPDAVSVTASTGMAASNIGGESPLCLLYQTG